jgi:hypothetical protein
MDLLNSSIGNRFRNRLTLQEMLVDVFLDSEMGQ